MVSLKDLPIELKYKIFDNIPVKQLFQIKDVIQYAQEYIDDMDDVEMYPVVEENEDEEICRYCYDI